jgi:threonine synthase
MGPSFLRCVDCGRHYTPSPAATTCPACREDSEKTGILDLVFEDSFFSKRQHYEPALLNPERSRGIWAYDRLLPVDPNSPKKTLGEGHTPLICVPDLASCLGQKSLWIKNECQNPTGSLKDRIAAVVTAKALETKAKTMIVISSGNMAASVAAYGSVNNLNTIVIVSPAVNAEKLLPICAYGGRVIRVRGTSDDRIKLCSRAAERFGWYNATSPYNPYGAYGAKTTAYEIFAQNGGQGFDWIIMPVGFGCTIVGIWKGFEDLRKIGLIDRLPRIVAVQPVGSPSLVKAFELGLRKAVPGPQDTIAGGISQVASPNSVLALEALQATKGAAVAVTDEEMIASISLLARKTGIYAEPSGVAALAGFRRMNGKGIIKPHEKTLLLITGTGLKDPLSAGKVNPRDIPEIDPSLDLLATHANL